MNPLHLIPGLTRKRRQDVLVLTQDGGAADDQLEVKKRCAAKHDTTEAWVLDQENLIHARGNGHYVQILSDVSLTPLPLYTAEKKQITNETINKIAEEITDEEIAFLSDRQHKRDIVGWVGVSLVAVVVTIIVIVIIAIV